MIDSVVISEKIAVTIGISIATTVPNVKVRMNIAARIPMSSLDSVAGLEIFVPRTPPVWTSMPTFSVGPFAASTIFCASSTDSEPGLTDVVTDM